MSDNDNVINFPNSKYVSDSLLPTNKEELDNSISEHRMLLVDEIINTMMPYIAEKLFVRGFPIEEPELFRDFVFVGELLKALMYKSVGVDHPLYEVIEENRSKLKELTDIEDFIMMEIDEDFCDDEY